VKVTEFQCLEIFFAGGFVAHGFGVWAHATFVCFLLPVAVQSSNKPQNLNLLSRFSILHLIFSLRLLGIDQFLFQFEHTESQFLIFFSKSIHSLIEISMLFAL
jgi:hypothetical protein